MYLGPSCSSSHNNSTLMRMPEQLKVPDSNDWKTRGVVTGIKDQVGICCVTFTLDILLSIQRTCGACWSFAASGDSTPLREDDNNLSHFQSNN